MKASLARQSLGHAKDEKTDTYDHSCRIVPRKGNHEPTHEQSYIGLDPKFLAPLSGLPTASSRDRHSFVHCGSFVLPWP